MTRWIGLMQFLIYIFSSLLHALSLIWSLLCPCESLIHNSISCMWNCSTQWINQMDVAKIDNMYFTLVDCVMQCPSGWSITTTMIWYQSINDQMDRADTDFDFSLLFIFFSLLHTLLLFESRMCPWEPSFIIWSLPLHTANINTGRLSKVESCVMGFFFNKDWFITKAFVWCCIRFYESDVISCLL